MAKSCYNSSMEKKFSIELHERKEEPKYRLQLIAIINKIEKRVRYVNPEENKTLHEEIHKKKLVDARKEKIEFEPIREDICKSFGVPYDDEHVYILDAHKSLEKQKALEQRVLRCFYVMIDVMRKEAYYAEGRTIHNILLKKIVDMTQRLHPEITEEKVFSEIQKDEAPEFLMFKGFMSLDKFSPLSEHNRKDQEQVIYDTEGKPIETAEGWFISGHNIPQAEKSA